MNYPNVAFGIVKDVSWCAVFRSGKILLTLLMVKLTFTPISGIGLLGYIWWQNFMLESHHLNDRGLF